MPMVNGKKYPYTAAGKAAAKKAASAKPKATPKPKPTPTKKATPTPTPKLKPNKNWRTAPPDYDVIIPGFNDPATIKKYSKKK